MLSGFELLYYNSDEIDYYLNIVEKIESNVNNYKSNDGWRTFNYSLSQKFIITLQGIIDNYIIRINNKINQAVILFPYNKDYTRKINIKK
jgi:hypothetical protein